MENRIIKFANEKFGEIRTMSINNVPWFLGKDVAVALGYAIPNKAILDHVDNNDRNVLKYKAFSDLEKASGLWNGKDFSDKLFINESGLYALILGSRLDSAKDFKRWVTAEVLPQIRKTGGYIPVHDEDGNELSDEEFFLRAQMILQKTIDAKDELIAQQQRLLADQHRLLGEQQQLLEEQQPMVRFAEAVKLSDDCYCIGDVANIIASNNIPMGRQRLFNWLRRNKYMFKNSRKPMQRWVEKGVFTVHIYTYHDVYGHQRSYPTTMVTGLGVQHLLDKFKALNS